MLVTMLDRCQKKNLDVIWYNHTAQQQSRLYSEAFVFLFSSFCMAIQFSHVKRLKLFSTDDHGPSYLFHFVVAFELKGAYMFSVKTWFGSCILTVNLHCKMWHTSNFTSSLFSLIFWVAFWKRIRKKISSFYTNTLHVAHTVLLMQNMKLT